VPGRGAFRTRNPGAAVDVNEGQRLIGRAPTGPTGKTKTLQVSGRQLADARRPVWSPTLKGDLSGTLAGRPSNDRSPSGPRTPGDEWASNGYSVEFPLGGVGGTGVAASRHDDEFGPTLAVEGARLNDPRGVLARARLSFNADTERGGADRISGPGAVIQYLVSERAKAAPKASLGGRLVGHGGRDSCSGVIGLSDKGGEVLIRRTRVVTHPPQRQRTLLRTSGDKGRQSEPSEALTKPAGIARVWFQPFLSVLLDGPVPRAARRWATSQAQMWWSSSTGNLAVQRAARRPGTAVTPDSAVDRSKGVGVCMREQEPADACRRRARSARKRVRTRVWGVHAGRRRGVAKGSQEVTRTKGLRTCPRLTSARYAEGDHHRPGPKTGRADPESPGQDAPAELAHGPRSTASDQQQAVASSAAAGDPKEAAVDRESAYEKLAGEAGAGPAGRCSKAPKATSRGAGTTGARKPAAGDVLGGLARLVARSSRSPLGVERPRAGETSRGVSASA